MNDISFPIWIRLLYKVNNSTKTVLSKDLNVTYQHVFKVCNILKKRDLIYMEHKGREVFINLTPRGVIIRDSITKIIEITKFKFYKGL
jgi:predicted transcriptional regulator